MTWVIMQCTGKCVTGDRASVPEVAFAYRDPYCPLHGDAVADAETLRESLRWVRGELRKADAENNAGREHDRKMEFLRAAISPGLENHDKALRVLAGLAMDELDELEKMLNSEWIKSAIDRQIQLYEMGVVPRHDAGRPDHD
jgi:hypothetical protein